MTKPYIPTNYTLEEILRIMEHTIPAHLYYALIERLDEQNIEWKYLEDSMQELQQDIDRLEQELWERDQEVENLQDKIDRLSTRLEEEGIDPDKV